RARSASSRGSRRSRHLCTTARSFSDRGLTVSTPEGVIPGRADSTLRARSGPLRLWGAGLRRISARGKGKPHAGPERRRPCPRELRSGRNEHQPRERDSSVYLLFVEAKARQVGAKCVFVHRDQPLARNVASPAHVRRVAHELNVTFVVDV